MTILAMLGWGEKTLYDLSGYVNESKENHH
jgi:hypothetical protein